MVNERIAIVGAGISGLLAARLLDPDHDVHVFEANGYAGGHANTVPFDVFGRRYAADTGFMVYNHRTYPNFVAMLRLLGLSGRPSDMSFSVRSSRSGLEYQGSSLNGLFAQRRNLFSRPFYRMLRDILRFNRDARQVLQQPGRRHDAGGLSAARRIRPRSSSTTIWCRWVRPSGPRAPNRLLQFPARFIITFFDNHGLLQVTGHPRWQTVEGGSVRYVKALTRPFAYRIRLNTPVRSIRRRDDGVLVEPERGVPERFDRVVLAAHADQSLALLADASGPEREILSALPVPAVEAILHLDPSMLPRSRRAWASWNYRVPAEPDRPVVLTYNLNRLEGLRSRTPICVTLNDDRGVDERTILQRIEYHHPTYSAAALAAQKRFHEINGRNRTYFCGAYWGYGFHEDGVTSALAVARCFDLQPGW